MVASEAASSVRDGEALLLFDGVCVMCSAFVHYVVDRDPEGRFKFAPLQSDIGASLLERHGLPKDMSTVVLIEAGTAHVRSTAALKVLAHCSRVWWFLATLLLLIPAPLRDMGYRAVAHTRYNVFGKDEDVCRRATPAMRERIVSD